MRNALRNILKFIAKSLFFSMGVILSVILVPVMGGYTSQFFILLTSLFGFIISFVIRYFLRKFFTIRKPEQSFKKMCLEFIVYIILFQLLLIVVQPLSSIVPGRLLEILGTIRYVEGEECDIEKYTQSAKSFWKDSIDFRNVHLVEGGIVRNLFLLSKTGLINKDWEFVRVAETFGSTIYVADASTCIPKYVFFHEMTHVWQFQKERKKLFGITSTPTWVYYYYTQFTDSDTLYDYGGYYGLTSAFENGESFRDFGVEIQATIIEDLNWLNEGYILSEGVDFTNSYKKLLEIYAQQMLNPG